MPEAFAADFLRSHIHLIRGHRVLLHGELARLYGVPSTRLLAQSQRFPGDFCFQLEPAEILNFTDERPGIREGVHGFTEHGAVVAAYLLDTPRAIAASATII